jgi:DNA-binding PadR family transcriptional regulator
MPKSFLGEFEQMVLLAILQRGDEAYGLDVRKELDQSAGRDVSRGAFYTTLDRMEAKGYVKWKTMPAAADRGGMPQRLFKVTPAGIRALRASRKALLTLWRGLDEVLG